MIKIEHLQKYFNRGKRSEIHVLNDITLELPQTGLVCILGECYCHSRRNNGMTGSFFGTVSK